MGIQTTFGGVFTPLMGRGLLRSWVLRYNDSFSVRFRHTRPELWEHHFRLGCFQVVTVGEGAFSKKLPVLGVDPLRGPF